MAFDPSKLKAMQSGMAGAGAADAEREVKLSAIHVASAPGGGGETRPFLVSDPRFWSTTDPPLNLWQGGTTGSRSSGKTVQGWTFEVRMRGMTSKSLVLLTNGFLLPYGFGEVYIPTGTNWRGKPQNRSPFEYFVPHHPFSTREQYLSATYLIPPSVAEFEKWKDAMLKALVKLATTLGKQL